MDRQQSNFVRRERPNRKRVDFLVHERAERCVDHPVTRLQRLAGKSRGHESQSVMTAAALRSGMPDVPRRFILDVDRLGREAGKPFAYQLSYGQRSRRYGLGTM